jgi:hypothetical protein
MVELIMVMYTTNNPEGRVGRTEELDPHEDSERSVIQIDRDRYRGHYSGHSYTAWIGVRPSMIDGPDPECDEFWEEWKDKLLFGGGETPQEAFKDLIKKADALDIYLVDDEPPYYGPVLIITIYGDNNSTKPKIILCNSDEYRKWFSS